MFNFCIVFITISILFSLEENLMRAAFYLRLHFYRHPYIIRGQLVLLAYLKQVLMVTN